MDNCFVQWFSESLISSLNSLVVGFWLSRQDSTSCYLLLFFLRGMVPLRRWTGPLLLLSPIQGEVITPSCSSDLRSDPSLRLVPFVVRLPISKRFLYLFCRYAPVEALVRILGSTEEPVPTPLGEEDNFGLDLPEGCAIGSAIGAAETPLAEEDDPELDLDDPGLDEREDRKPPPPISPASPAALVSRPAVVLPKTVLLNFFSLFFAI